MQMSSRWYYKSWKQPRKEDFHRKVQINSIFPGPQSLPHVLSSNISSVHHTLLEISFKVHLSEWHDAKVVLYGRKTISHLLVCASLLQSLKHPPRKEACFPYPTFCFLFLKHLSIRWKQWHHAGTFLPQSTQHLSGKMLTVNTDHAC